MNRQDNNRTRQNTRIYLADIDKGNGVLKWLANTRQLPVFARTRFWEGCHHYWWGKLYACCVGKSFNLEENYHFEIIITAPLMYNYIEVVPLTLHHSEHETNLKSHSAKNSLLFFSLVHGVIVALGDLTLTSSTFQLSSWYDPWWGPSLLCFLCCTVFGCFGILSCMTGKAPLGVLYVTMQHSLHGVHIGVSFNRR